jgi:hypothetical protein
MSKGSGSHGAWGEDRQKWSGRPFSNAVTLGISPLRRGDVLDPNHAAVAQPHPALQEHARVHVARHASARRRWRDAIERVQQAAHVIPVAVRDRHGLDLGEGHPEIAAVPHEERTLGAGVEQQRVAAMADVRGQDEGQAELRAAQRGP